MFTQVLGPSEHGALPWDTGRKPVKLALLVDEGILVVLTWGVSIIE